MVKKVPQQGRTTCVPARFQGLVLLLSPLLGSQAWIQLFLKVNSFLFSVKNCSTRYSYMILPILVS